VQAGQHIPHPSGDDFERMIGYRISAKRLTVAWDTSEPPSTNLVIYKVERTRFDESLLRKIADKFAIRGDSSPLPEDKVEAPGFWIRELNPTNSLKWRCAVFSQANGKFGYYSGDDGDRYDSLTRKHNIQGVPENAAALATALELLPLLNLSTNDLEHP